MTVGGGRRLRVLVADDQGPGRAGVRSVLEPGDEIEVVAEASDGAEAVALAHRMNPDLVLIDVRMPGMDAIEATRKILRGRPGERPAVVVTTFELDDAVFDALRAGASGFLLMEPGSAEAPRATTVVAAGQALASPDVTRRVMGEFATRRAPRRATPDRLDLLTPREREVTALAAQGLTNEEIGERLSISPATAKTHANRAMRKLGAKNRAQLVVIAYEAGLGERR